MVARAAADPQKAPYTDIENAALFVDKYKGRLHYVHAWKAWVSWDGTRWAKDTDEKVYRLAASLSDDIRRDSMDAPDPARRTELFKIANRLASVKTIRDMLALAKTMVPKSPDDFDRDPALLNTPFSTVQLGSGRFYDSESTDDLCRMTEVSYDPDAECPTWHSFLHSITAGNVGLIDFLQRAVGYSLTGYTSERVAFILYGTGRNGKSTFLRTICNALGDYAGVASASLILSGRDEKAFNDLAALRGLRLVWASESGKGRQMDGAFFKLITGDEPVTARFLYSEFFTFRPQFKLWLATNHRPEADSEDEAFWDRLRLIPFTVRIPDADVDRDLDRKLQAELPGILRWAVQGAEIWSRDGLGRTTVVDDATKAYRRDSDILGQWIAERCEVNPISKYRTGALFDDWRSFTRSQGPTVKAGKVCDFVSAMAAKGFDRVMGGGNKSYLAGLSLKQEGPDDDHQ